MSIVDEEIRQLLVAAGQMPVQADTLSALADAYERIGDHERAGKARFFAAGTPHYRSQFFQDIYFDQYIFGGLCGGVFLDIGAHDGESLSNSYFFEKARGWSGICIEANPILAERIQSVRKTECLNVCLSDTDGVIERFVHVAGADPLSGIARFFNDHQLRAIHHYMQLNGGSVNYIDLPTARIDTVLRQRSIEEVHLLSIDTEGAEYAILRHFPFDSVYLQALTVEMHMRQVELKPLVDLLQEKGFRPVRWLGADVVFLNASSPFQPRASLV